MTLIVPQPASVSTAELNLSDLVPNWLKGRKPATRSGYDKDWRMFKRWIGEEDNERAALFLLGRGAVHGDELVRQYQDELIDEEKKPNTVNRRIAVLRSLSDRAKPRVGWKLDVKGVRVEQGDVDGIPWDKAMEAIVTEPRPEVACLLWLLVGRGLRINEALGLGLENVEPDYGAAWVLGKGRRLRERLTLSEPISAALRDWVAIRGRDQGALFGFTYARAWELIGAAGDRVGVRLWPHALRHTAINRALEVTGDNLVLVQEFSRHKDVRTLMLYVRRRRNAGGDVARLMVADVPPAPVANVVELAQRMTAALVA